VRRFVKPISESADASGWFCFECALDASIEEGAHFKLYQRNEDDSPTHAWESDAHNRELPRSNQRRFPNSVWFVQDTARVLADDPMGAESRTVRIHLITSKRYRYGKLFIWSPDRNARRTLELAGHDEVGPYWDVDLQDRDRHLFSFKFLRNIDNKDIYEPGYANRLYLSTDGSEIWTHSEGREVIWSRPEKKLLTVHFQQRSDIGPPQMHLWQEASDFATDVEVSSTDNGWSQYEFLL
jgi:hypothetical protein